MAGYIDVCSDWDLLDMVEGLRHPSTLEKEMAKRFRRLLEQERQRKFETQDIHHNERKHDD